jgi:hypothetical protein
VRRFTAAGPRAATLPTAVKKEMMEMGAIMLA